MENRVIDNSVNNPKHSHTRNVLVFLICSGIGIFTFFVPLPNGKMLFEVIYKTFIIKPLGENIKWLILLVCLFNFGGLILGKTGKDKSGFLYKKFHDYSVVQMINVVLGLLFIIIALADVGPWFLRDDKTVKYMIFEIFPFTCGCLTVGGMVLPLLTHYGILEFVGILLEPIMRPVLKLPGKAAIDTIASIVGAAVVGIFLTTSLYHDNQYTDREALSITTSFSLNSVGYCAFLIGVVGMTHMFGIMFLAYLIVAYIIAAIIVRIPPVSLHPDIYENGTILKNNNKGTGEKYEGGLLKEGFRRALQKADQTDNVFKDVIHGTIGGFMVFVEIIPMMAVIGGISLAVYHYTPIIKILSMPLAPYISLFGIQEASLAAESIFLGGIELAMPAFTIAESTNIQAVQFFVVMVSLVQVLYITETMLPIISFGLPVKLWELIVIWVERTLIAIPLMAIVTHILF